MIIIMKPHVSNLEIEKIKSKIESLGCTVHTSQGENSVERNKIAIIAGTCSGKACDGSGKSDGEQL